MNILEQVETFDKFINKVEHSKGYIAIIDNFKNLQEFKNSFEKELDCPYNSKSKDELIEQLKDLSWIFNKNIIILLENYQLKKSEKEEIEQIISEILFPFWEGEAKDFYKGNELKTFEIYSLNRAIEKDVPFDKKYYDFVKCYNKKPTLKFIGNYYNEKGEKPKKSKSAK